MKSIYEFKTWDKAAPPPEYFTELFRVSKNQILWGANHYISRIPYDSSCWLVWDKDNGVTDFADCEIAWTSFKTAARLYRYKWNGFQQGNMKNKETRIHPTQKPAELYRWIYNRYANEGDKILDTHAGSGSSLIAAHDMQLLYIGFELDPDYYAKARERLDNHKAQLNIFSLPDSDGGASL